MKIHSGEKPYQCNQCEKPFAHVWDLVKHKRVHTGEKLYQCRQSNETFSNGSYIKVHMMNHTGEKLYKCSIPKNISLIQKAFFYTLLIFLWEKPKIARISKFF